MAFVGPSSGARARRSASRPRPCTRTRRHYKKRLDSRLRAAILHGSCKKWRDGRGMPPVVDVIVQELVSTREIPAVVELRIDCGESAHEVTAGARGCGCAGSSSS